MCNRCSSLVRSSILWSILVDKTCGVLTALMSKTLGNINVDWHNLILSRLCTLDTCAIGDKILSTDWQLSCWECGLAAQLLRAACINLQGRKLFMTKILASRKFCRLEANSASCRIKTDGLCLRFEAQSRQTGRTLPKFRLPWWGGSLGSFGRIQSPIRWFWKYDWRHLW